MSLADDPLLFQRGSITVCYDPRVGLNILLLDGASSIDLQPLIPSTKILQWQLGQTFTAKVWFL
jgi:hypothetical protein